MIHRIQSGLNRHIDSHGGRRFVFLSILVDILTDLGKLVILNMNNEKLKENFFQFFDFFVEFMKTKEIFHQIEAVSERSLSSRCNFPCFRKTIGFWLV